MSTLTLDPAATAVPADSQARRTLIFAIGSQVALLVPSLLAYGLDDRLVNGINVWTKPIKFQLSLGVMLLTLVWLLPLLSGERRASRLIRSTSLGVAAAAALEIGYITLQSARGRASHFNLATPAEAIMYNVMGAGALMLVVGCFIFGAAICRTGPSPRGEGLRVGAAVGLMLGAVLTLITASVLASSGEAGHWIGGVRTDAGGLPLFGWSMTGGDLRVPHFFATHLMQALPILGLAADRTAPRSAGRVVWAGAGLGVIVVAATFAQAMAGAPFVR